MELSVFEVQVFISLLVVLAVAFAALICDYLKHNNEKLREHNIELRVRDEERGSRSAVQAVRWLQYLMGSERRYRPRTAARRPAPVPAPAPVPRPAPTATAAPAARPPAPPQPAPPPATASAPPAPEISVAAAPAPPEPPAPTEAIPAPAVSEAVAPPPPQAAPEVAPETVLEGAAPLPVPPRKAAPPPAAPTLLESLPVPDWIRKEHEDRAARARAGLPRTIDVVATTDQQIELPVGYHSAVLLEALQAAPGTFSGVVVAVAINEYAVHTERFGLAAMQELMRGVEALLKAFLRPERDFGCRLADDEFLLIFPKEAGPEANRRLTAISERLWTFQIRSLNQSSVFFSWGAVEVQGERLADAIGSAQERMQQSRRSRKTVSMDAQRRRLAVNE